jgi:hypothetical protein
MSLTIELENSAEQTAFNLKRWAEVLADPDLARLPHRIETDRHGHILVSPPPAPAHGDRESEIVFQLKTFLPEGRTITNCPVSTSDGVKAPDVAWVVPERRLEVRSLIPAHDWGCLMEGRLAALKAIPASATLLAPCGPGVDGRR